MIRVSRIRISAKDPSQDLVRAAAKKLHIKPAEIHSLKIVKKSLDARDKADIFWNYIADIEADNEGRILKRNRDVQIADTAHYHLPPQGNEPLENRPCIIGTGPAGLFCGYFLAKEGYRPILIERGEQVEERMRSAEIFWKENRLNPSSNVQFGEGGAGTFSDGKLNTQVKDKAGRNALVLETFVAHGAPEDIVYINKPHIGTDVLAAVVKNMREEIRALGGEVLFNTRFIGFKEEKGHIRAITLENKEKTYDLPCDCLVLAIGHSARDTFYMLREKGLHMEAKAFALGLRVQHSQEDINKAMYGENYAEIYQGLLPPADYKLTYKAKSGRGVYSFCMCPGGYVVNASSEEGLLCVNGMSFSKRDGAGANSAIVVTVTPEDTKGDEDPLKGVEFQRGLERKAYEEGRGLIPAQTLKSFKDPKAGNAPGQTVPQTKGSIHFADINNILPAFICQDIKEAFEDYGRKIAGFDKDDTLLYAVESRTSSPIRINRNEDFESSIKGIYPAGEGAGYAGGIMSSAMDGVKIFEEIYSRFKI